MAVQARSLWRKGVALFAELDAASQRLGVLDGELTTLAERTDAAAEELAVFADPARLRQARAQRRSRSSRLTRHRAPAVRPTEPGRATAR